MRISKKILTISAFLMFASSQANAASVSFVKKTPAGSLGNFNYTYEYSCNSGKKGTLVVTSANDNEAKTLAELDAQDKCGESTISPQASKNIKKGN